MCECVLLIKNNKHGDWKRGNFAEKPKLYGTSEQKEKNYGRETETRKEKRKFEWTEEMVEYLLSSPEK